MPDTEPALAEKVAERIRREIERNPFPVGDGDKRLDITISVGVASLKGEPDTVEAMMKRADIALYEAKNAGRNRVVASAA